MVRPARGGPRYFCLLAVVLYFFLHYLCFCCSLKVVGPELRPLVWPVADAVLLTMGALRAVVLELGLELEHLKFVS